MRALLRSSPYAQYYVSRSILTQHQQQQQQQQHTQTAILTPPPTPPQQRSLTPHPNHSPIHSFIPSFLHSHQTPTAIITPYLSFPFLSFPFLSSPLPTATAISDSITAHPSPPWMDARASNRYKTGKSVLILLSWPLFFLQQRMNLFCVMAGLQRLQNSK